MLAAVLTETALSAPTFLVAVPSLRDPNFQNTVVLVLEHHPRQGSMGLIINRPSLLPIGAFCASQRMVFHGDVTALVYKGGPVQTDRAFILHSSEHEGPETTCIHEKLKLSYSLESLKLLAQAPPEYMRVFLGYAGWGPGQLAQEMTMGSWLVVPPDNRFIFNTPVDDIWNKTLSSVGIDAYRLGIGCAYN
jgi:putative transcriptional regulator